MDVLHRSHFFLLYLVGHKWPRFSKERIPCILKMISLLNFYNISRLRLRHWQTCRLIITNMIGKPYYFQKLWKKRSARQFLPMKFPWSMAKFQHPFNICRAFMGWGLCVEVYIFINGKWNKWLFLLLFTLKIELHKQPQGAVIDQLVARQALTHSVWPST